MAVSLIFFIENKKRINLAAFITLFIYSISFTIYYNFSVNGYNARIHYVEWGFYLISILVISSVNWDKGKLLNTLAIAIILSGLIQVFHSIDDMQNDLGRILGNTIYPNFLSMLLIAGITASLFLVIDNYFSKQRRWGLIYIIPIIILFFAAFRTGSRNIMILLPLMVFILLFQYRKRIAFIGLAAVILIIFLIPSHSKYRLLHEGENNPYGVQRMNIYKQVIDIMIHHPCGIGYNNLYYYTLQNNFPVEGRIGRYAVHAKVAHNEYLEWAVNTGIIGSIILLLLFAYIIIQIKKSRIGHNADKLLMTLFLLYCAMSLFDSALYLPYNAVIFIIAVGILIGKSKMVFKPVYIISVIPLFIIIWAFDISDIYGTYRIQSLNSKLNSKNEISLNIYKDISNELKHLYSITGKPQCIESDIIISEILLERTGYVEYFQEILNGYSVLLNKYPMEYRYYITYAQMLNEYKNTVLRRNSNIDSLIIANYEKGLEYDPYRPFNRYAYVIQLMNMGDTASAISQLKTAVEYEPYFLNGLQGLYRLTDDTLFLEKMNLIINDIDNFLKQARMDYEKKLLQY